MAEYKEVMLSAQRMCAAHRSCIGCPAEDIHRSSGAMLCRINDMGDGADAVVLDFNKFEKIVLDWAALHPSKENIKCMNTDCPLRPLDGYCSRECSGMNKKAEK